MPDFLSVCEEAARSGGDVLLNWIGRISVREKAPADLVTEADVASQEAIRQIILGAFPSHGFISEEAPVERRSQPDYCWIVDPLDGTTNYVHSMPHYAVSVALEHRGRLIAGTVFDPSNGETFTAEAGCGAFLNGEPLKTASTKELAQALVAISFPPRVLPDSIHIRDFTRTVIASQSIRRLGSAALNLCYVAAGRLDAYMAREIQSWDVAAGALLVREAGGTLTGIDGLPFSLDRPPFVAAATAELHAEVLALVAE
jgi:myo-inositol-1(or 4)-monophosphatase